jgi:hypothetical protein
MHDVLFDHPHTTLELPCRPSTGVDAMTVSVSREPISHVSSCDEQLTLIYHLNRYFSTLGLT